MNVIPSKNGVSPGCVSLPVGHWATLIDFLTHRFPAISRAEWIQRMQQGNVVNAHNEPVQPDAPYQSHIKIYYYRDLPHEIPIPFEETVLYQDDYLVVADKPHFLPVTPAGNYVQETLLVRLKRKLGIDTLAPIHRIDRETAGVVLFSVQPATRNLYHALFRDRQVQKHYEAIAPVSTNLSFPLTYRSRLVESDFFRQMHEIEGEPNAETKIELTQRAGELARYKLSPVSGQKHQLRVHMAALGLPILNDLLYPVDRVEKNAAPIEPDYAKPLQLLAKAIAFVDPLSGQAHCFESPRQLLLTDVTG